MDRVLPYIVTALVSYLIGSVSFSIIISRLFHNTDIRKHGSGNAGGTNAIRVLGPLPGAFVLLGDFLKGILAVYLGKQVFFGKEFLIGAIFAGLFVIIGHVFPIFFRFKGGKGVATGAGLVLMIDWRVFLMLLLVFICVLLISKYVSLSSMAAAVSLPVLTYLFNRDAQQLPVILALIAFLGAFIVYTHRANIVRLRQGTESKIGRKKDS